MDDLIKQLIIDNRILLTLLAMFGTPVGFYAIVRWMQRSPPSSAPVRDAVADARVRQLEHTVAALERELTAMQLQQARLTALLQRQLEQPSPTIERRAATPV